GAHELRVVDLGVPIREAAAQSAAIERRAIDQILFRKGSMMMKILAAGQKVVKHEPDLDLEPRARTVGIHRQQDLDRLDELGQLIKQPLAIAKVFSNQTEVQAFEIAKP